MYSTSNGKQGKGIKREGREKGMEEGKENGDHPPTMFGLKAVLRTVVHT